MVSLVAQLVKNPPAMWETWVQSLDWEDSPGEEKGYPLQYYGLENFIDCIVYGATKSLGSQRSDMTERLSPSHTQVSKHISLICQLKGLKSKDTPIAKITRTIHILVSNTSSQRRNQNSREVVDSTTGVEN